MWANAHQWLKFCPLNTQAYLHPHPATQATRPPTNHKSHTEIESERDRGAQSSGERPDCSLARRSPCRNQGHHGKNTGIIKIIFDFTSTYVYTVPPRSHPAHTTLTPRSHLAQVPFSLESCRPPPAAPSPTSTQHPTPNHRQTSIDHGIRARRCLAPQRGLHSRSPVGASKNTSPPTLSAS
jgi:hypothetical protein